MEAQDLAAIRSPAFWEERDDDAVEQYFRDAGVLPRGVSFRLALNNMHPAQRAKRPKIDKDSTSALETKTQGTIALSDRMSR